jgi:cysteine desulfurase family protein (TIGR01976 family)
MLAMTTVGRTSTFDPNRLRAQFPALSREIDGRAVAYLDGPGGTQVPTECIDAISAYLSASNSNHGGAFAASVETDALVADAHAAMADFMGAHDPSEIVFGPNMTTLTLAASRAIGRDLVAGDEMVVTRLDHDANVAPWLAVAEDRGARIRWVDLRPDDGTLDLDGLADAMGPRTRVVAVGHASNALGTINDIGRAIELAHAVGALAFIDAVHSAPHVELDVAAMQADLVACSPYKFFGPHLGVLYGRAEVLERLRAYRVRPAGDAIPGRFETGTQNHEALAGLLGTIRYLESVGRTQGDARPDADRRGRLRSAMTAIRVHERELARAALAGLRDVPGLRLYGIADEERLDERVPTFAFTLAGHNPRAVAEHLARRAISVWDGDFYAWELVRRLDLDDGGGLVRAGFVHYNTLDEVARLTDALREIRSHRA